MAGRAGGAAERWLLLNVTLRPSQAGLYACWQTGWLGSFEIGEQVEHGGCVEDSVALTADSHLPASAQVEGVGNEWTVRESIHVWLTHDIYGGRMDMSWKFTPFAIKVGGFAALAGFFVSLTSTSSRSVNGRLTECNYTDFGALFFGAIAILAGLAGIAAALSDRHNRSFNLGVSVLIILVGVLHIMRGIGAVGGPCN